MLVTDVAVFVGEVVPVRMEAACPSCGLKLTVFVRPALLDRDRVLRVLDHDVMVVPALNAPPDAFVTLCGCGHGD